MADADTMMAALLIVVVGVLAGYWSGLRAGRRVEVQSALEALEKQRKAHAVVMAYLIHKAVPGWTPLVAYKEGDVIRSGWQVFCARRDMEPGQGSVKPGGPDQDAWEELELP